MSGTEGDKAEAATTNKEEPPAKNRFDNWLTVYLPLAWSAQLGNGAVQTITGQLVFLDKCHFTIVYVQHQCVGKQLITCSRFLAFHFVPPPPPEKNPQKCMLFWGEDTRTNRTLESYLKGLFHKI
jgi:hypothetical protein